MSEQVRRYEFDENGVCYHQPDGPFVSYDDYARLQAEVERLRKAGDELLHEWSSGDETDGRNFKKGLVLWNAAKEGKQS